MELLRTLVTLVLFFGILGGLVLIHEVGHFVTARLAKVRVREFGIGFPPRARVLAVGKPSPEEIAWVERRRQQRLAAVQHDPQALEELLDEEPEVARGTEYTLNWLPIGGFVKLDGEDGEDPDDPGSFASKSLPTRLIILVSGVLMNLILAFAIFTGITLFADRAIALRFDTVVPGSPAEQVGLVPGDAIVAIDGRQFSAFEPAERFLDALASNAGRTTTLTILHEDGSSDDVTVTLRVPTENEGALGISGMSGAPAGAITYTVPQALGVGVDRTVEAFGLILGGLAQLGDSIVSDPTAPPPAQGPVGIATSIGDVFWSLGPIYVLYIAGLLSANLALVNVLPIPPLDGGRMLMILLKALPAGDRISLRAERLTYVIGFVALFAFLIWITVFDLARLGGVIE